MEKELTKTKWAIDLAHSAIGFKVKHLVVATVKGSFAEFGGSISTLDEDFTTAEIDLWINSASINTGIERRDAHLRSADFFHVDKFKAIDFTSNKILKTGKDGKYHMYGNLTMRGITKEIKLDVEFQGVTTNPKGNKKAVFHVRGTINRSEWGLNYNRVLETGGVLVSDDVSIDCEVQLTRK